MCQFGCIIQEHKLPTIPYSNNNFDVDKKQIAYKEDIFCIFFAHMYYEVNQNFYTLITYFEAVQDSIAPLIRICPFIEEHLCTVWIESIYQVLHH